MLVHVGSGCNAWESRTNAKQMQTARAKRGKTGVLEIKNGAKYIWAKLNPICIVWKFMMKHCSKNSRFASV